MNAAVDWNSDLMVRSPGATAALLPWLEQAGVRALVTGPDCPLRGTPFSRFAEVTADQLAAARTAGFDGAALIAPAGKAELDRCLREYDKFIALVYLKPEQIAWDVRPAQAVLRHGAWPGIAARDIQTASATASVWLDANTSLIAQLRAQYPWRPAILSYEADASRSLPAHAAAVALADAASAGGNVIFTLPAPARLQPPRDVHQFLRAGAAVLRAPLAGRTAVLCGTIEESGEILNLAFRKNLCPVALPIPSPLTTALYDVVVAANVEMPPGAVAGVVRFAESGGMVLAAPAGDKKDGWWSTRGWKKLRTEEGRDVLAAGRGLVYAYHDAIYDPGNFALDMKDAAAQRAQPAGGLKNLDLRIWSADSVLGVLHRLSPTSVAVVLTAYGNLPRHDFLLSVRGRYRRGVIREPGRDTAQPVRLMPRSGRVEINLAQLARIAILTLEK